MSHPQANPIEPPAVEPSPQPPLSSPAVQPSAARAYKNLLQEHAHKLSLPVPTYCTYNEGLSHFPKFRATVWVNGKSFTSPNTFLHRKEAEQDVARIAYDELHKMVKNQPMPQLSSIHEELVFSKSILNELAVKMRVEMPTYITRQIEGDAPSFESTLSFNDVAWPPCIGKNKKEAEQLAARAAIHTFMGNAEIGAILAPILRSKAKSYVNMHAKQCTPATEPVVAAVVWTSTEKNLSSLPDDTMLSFAPNQCTPVTEPVAAAVVGSSAGKNLSSLPDDTMISFAPNQCTLVTEPAVAAVVGTSTSKDISSLPDDTMLSYAQNQCTPVTEPAVASVVRTSTGKDLSALPDDTMLSCAPPHHEIPSAQHEITAPKLEVSTLSQPCTSEVDLPITFVPASSGQPSDETPRLSKKRRKNRRKANKRARADEIVAG